MGADGIQAMVPGVGGDSGAADLAAGSAGPAVQGLFDHHGQGRGPQGQPARMARAAVVQGGDGPPADACAGRQQQAADEQGHKGFDTVVAVGMVFVRLPRPVVGSRR